MLRIVDSESMPIIPQTNTIKGSTSRVQHGPLRVTGIEPSANPPAASPTLLQASQQPPANEPSVRDAVMTLDTPQEAAAETLRPAELQSFPIAKATQIRTYTEGTAASPLELPDPARFSPNSAQPAWMAEETANESLSTAEQAAYESVSPGHQSEEIDSNVEMAVATDYEKTPDEWLREAHDAIAKSASVEAVETAIELCRRAAITSGNPEISQAATQLISQAYNRRGELHLDANRLDDALKDFRSAVEADPENSPALHNRAVTLAQAGEYDAALLDFNRVIDLNPSLTIAYRNRAELLMLRGQSKQAIDDYSRALQAEDPSGDLYLARAHALQQLGRFKEALADIDRALQLEPHNAKFMTSRANLFADSGDFDQAAADFQRSLEFDSNLAETHRGIAWLKATCPVDRHRDAFEALNAARKAAELSSPDDYLTLDALAAAHANAGEFQKAIDAIERALAAAPSDAAPPLQARLSLYRHNKPFRAATPRQ